MHSKVAKISRTVFLILGIMKLFLYELAYYVTFREANIKDEQTTPSFHIHIVAGFSGTP